MINLAYADKKEAFKYINEYQKEKYDRITVLVDKGKKDLYKEAAEKEGLSLSAFVMKCVDEKIKRIV